LAIGAHPDDIEIGAGGTIARLIEERPDTHVEWVVLSGDQLREGEARASARALVGDQVELGVRVLTGRDGYLPYQDAATLKDELAERADPRPDLVFVHRQNDAHQDHRFAAQLAWQLCRRSTILEYEIMKWDGDLRPVNLYVPLSEEQVDRKIAHLFTAFPSQAHRDWFTADAFQAILRVRGIEAGAPSGLAEGFVARKLIV
jgi:LmbE family N-acetylglucosaminyl deacetylase